MAKLRQRPAPSARAGRRSSQQERALLEIRGYSENRRGTQGKSQATATANATRTLSQQRLESLGLAQPALAAQPATPRKPGPTPQLA